MLNTKSIFQSIQQGLLICDKDGKILYFNKAYADFIGYRLEDVVGQPIELIRSGSVVPNVIKSGNAWENIFRTEDSQDYYANVYPIIDGEVVSGTISIVTTIDQEVLKMKPERTLKERVRDFEKKEIEEMLFVYGYDMEGKETVAKKLGISLATLYNKLNF